MNTNRRTLFFMWLGWSIVLLLYQVWVPARIRLQPPDTSLIWTAAETEPGSQAGKIYLNEPVLNRHVSWDSEYYLAIAINGYEDPNIMRVGESLGVNREGLSFWPFVMSSEGFVNQEGVSLSYAFFPFYPFMIRIVSLPLSILGYNPIATATIAGVLVSLLGALAGMIALYEIAKDELGETGAMRAAFYLLIFPSSFFLAQVYTEGLFIGLAFSSLWMLRREKWWIAAGLAALATLTRAVGVALVVPLLLYWVERGEWLDLDVEWRQIYLNGWPWRSFGRTLIILAPVIVFVIWKFSYFGMAFSRVEEEWFGRGSLALMDTYNSWNFAYSRSFGENTQATAYYAIEVLAVILGFTACITEMRKNRDLAWFGLVVVIISFTSGDIQGMYRYFLTVPPIFFFLSRLGERPAFDRVWTVGSTLVMGIMATLFMFDFWAG